MTNDAEISSRIDWKFWGIVFVLSLIGLGLRAYRVFDYGFWTDELNALKQSNNWDSIRANCAVWLSSPPMRYLLTSVLIHTFYTPELVRLPSLLAGALAVPAAMVLAKRWWDRRTAIWAGVLFAFNPWIIAHSQDGRMHAVVLLAILGAALLALPPPEKYKRTALTIAGFCLAFASALNYPAVLVSAGIFVAFIANSWRLPTGRLARETALLALPWFGWLLLWFGYLVYETPHNPVKNALFPVAREVETEPAPAPPPPPSDSIELMPLPPGLWTIGFFKFNLRSILWDGPLRWATLVGAGLFVLIGSGGKAPNIVARTAVFLIPYLLAISQRPDQFYPRYGLGLLSFALLGLAVSLAWVGRNRWIQGLLLLCVLGLQLPTTYRVLSVPPQAWEEALGYVVERWDRKDRLLVGTHQAELGVFLYNADRIPKRSIVYRVFVEDRLSVETIDNPDRCWLLQWFVFPPFVESIMNKWYDKAAVFPGRYGDIEVWRKKALDQVDVKKGYDVWGRPLPTPTPEPRADGVFH